MKSGKQRRAEIKTRRMQRRVRRGATKVDQREKEPSKIVRVNVDLLAPYNSYGVPRFVENGYYVDIPFQCAQCGKEEVWTGSQQKWWYEVAKGYVYSSAKHCRTCRRREQRRRAEARRIHLEGVERKKKQQV